MVDFHSLNCFLYQLHVPTSGNDSSGDILEPDSDPRLELAIYHVTVLD